MVNDTIDPKIRLKVSLNDSQKHLDLESSVDKKKSK